MSLVHSYGKSLQIILTMLRTLAAFSFFFLAFNQGYAQINYSLKAETGISKFQFNTVDIDPGPNWKGHYLEDKDGIDLNISNGVEFKDVFFAGIGLGYLNFEGIHGWTAYTDIEFLPLQTKLKPLINFKLGHSHIWNQ